MLFMEANLLSFLKKRWNKPYPEEKQKIKGMQYIQFLDSELEHTESSTIELLWIYT